MNPPLFLHNRNFEQISDQMYFHYFSLCVLTELAPAALAFAKLPERAREDENKLRLLKLIDYENSCYLPS